MRTKCYIKLHSESAMCWSALQPDWRKPTEQMKIPAGITNQPFTPTLKGKQSLSSTLHKINISYGQNPWEPMEQRLGIAGRLSHAFHATCPYLSHHVPIPSKENRLTKSLHCKSQKLRTIHTLNSLNIQVLLLSLSVPRFVLFLPGISLSAPLSLSALSPFVLRPHSA